MTAADRAGLSDSAFGRREAMFSDLIAPIELSEFRENYWNKASIHFPPRKARYASWVFDLDRLIQNLIQGSYNTIVKAQYFDSLGAHREVKILPSQVYDMFAAGMTICLGDVNVALPELEALAHEYRRSLRFAGVMDFSCYLSPPRRGFGLHFDDRPVFVCQLQGSKLWRFSKQPALAAPLRNFVYQAGTASTIDGQHVNVPHDDELDSVVMVPGDLLYLPAGAWHCTEAVTESLSLTLRVRDKTPMHILGDCLGAMFRGDSTWRQPMPIVERSEYQGVDIPDPVTSLLAERLKAFQAAVACLTVGDLSKAWNDPQVDAKSLS